MCEWVISDYADAEFSLCLIGKITVVLPTNLTPLRFVPSEITNKMNIHIAGT